MIRKAYTKFLSGRAYDVRTCLIDDCRFFLMRVDKSQLKRTHFVTLAYRVSVGRDEGRKPGVLIGARCTGTKCIAGDQIGCCSHIFTAQVCCAQIQSGQIKAGDVGDGLRNWGARAGASAVEAQPLEHIVHLTGGASLLHFTGFVPGTKLRSRMAKYISRYQELAKTNEKATIVELHAGVPIKRKGGDA